MIMPVRRPRALIVYESMYGNTQMIAETITNTLSCDLDADLVEVARAPARPEDLDLLIVGGPTHAFGMSRPGTRADARTSIPGADPAPTVGVREWLDQLPGSEGTQTAAFCTKIRSSLAGSAAKAIAKQLRRHGYRSISPPANFFVEDLTGPLQTGEIERARAWALQLGASLIRSGRP